MAVYRCSHLRMPQGYVEGAVHVRDGRIVAAGPARDVERDAGSDMRYDLGRAIVLPGLVNAHTHLELSWMRARRPAGGDYTSWLRGLLALRAEEDRATTRAAAESTCVAMLARGTVAAGDICNDTWIADIWSGKPASGVLFHEIYGLDEPRARLVAARSRIGTQAAPAGWRWSLAPHAPHTTSPELLSEIASEAEQNGVPTSIHAAESPAEVRLLERGGGGLHDFFIELGFLDAGTPAAGCRPLDRLRAAGLLRPGTLVIHAVQLTATEIEELGESGATVVTCPRSNDYLDVGTAPVTELLAAGAKLAVGTDSLASSPDLDLFGEMAALAAAHPGLPPATIVNAATLGGAEALGLDGDLGTIEPGKSARLAVVPFDGQVDPDAFLCSNPDRASGLADAPYA